MQSVDDLFDKVENRFVDAWPADAGLETYGEAVAELLAFREREGEPLDVKAAEWRKFAATASLYAAREKARSSAPTFRGTASGPRRQRVITRCAAAFRMRSPSRSRRRRSPTSSGWRRRRPTSTTPGTSPGRSVLSTRTR